MIFASELSAPAAAASERLFSDPEISLKKSGSWRFDTWLVLAQQVAVTYLGSGTVSMILAPPVLEMIFSTSFMVVFKAEGGASWRSPLRWYRPSSTDFSAWMGRLSSSVLR